jgi:hypothetical protein
VLALFLPLVSVTRSKHYEFRFCCVPVVRTDVSQEGVASIVRVIWIGELGTRLAGLLRGLFRFVFTANVVLSSPIHITLTMEAKHSSETWVLARATRLHNPEDGILHTHRRGYLRSYRVRLVPSHLPRFDKVCLSVRCRHRCGPESLKCSLNVAPLE